uniref:Uncharacterized protein n=1 Tax=viral metagenome TaxID=1070528 RepID=A0A6H1ZGN7_9ZZZZ
MKRFLVYLMQKLKCQRGEVGNDIDATAVADAVFTADIDDEGYTPPSDDEKGEPDDSDGGDNETIDDDEKTPDDDKKEPDPKLIELETKLADAQKEINRLGYALRKGEKKETGKEPPAFTKAQLLELYREHRDEPEVVFQIFEEMTKLGKADAVLSAEKSVDIKTKKTDMDNYIEKMYPDVKKEGTELYNAVQGTIEWAHLEGHPFAEHLAFSLLAVKNLPETIKKIKEEAKKEALKTSEDDLKKKTEEARKKKIVSSKPSTPGKPSESAKAVSLSADQMESLKRLVGSNPTKAQIARYAKMTGVKSETMHAEG